MSETATITSTELTQAQERVRPLSRDKSTEHLIINLMNRVSQAQGLDNIVESLLRNILDVTGGTTAMLYYLIDDDMYCADLTGTPHRVEQIDDEVIKRVLKQREPMKYEQDVSGTHVQAQEFTKAYSWGYPLMVGTDLVGIIKLENLPIAMRDLPGELPTFFAYAATLLKNEIYGQTRLKESYDQLSRMNKELKMEVAEREQTEEELRRARDELVDRVARRTAEMQHATEQLQQELVEHQRTQEALRRYTGEIEDLYNNAPCGYHSLDRDGMFVRINDTELRWLGYEREEVVGRRRFVDMATARSVQVFQENFPRFKAQGWIKDLEFELVRKDGSTFPVLVSATAIFDDNGAYLMSRSTAYDISERKKIQEQEHLLSTIVQSSDDAIIAKDLDGVILSWNRGAERIYGYGSAEAVGQSIDMLIPPGQEDDNSRIMTALKRGERIDHYATKRQRKDGRLISVSLTVSPIKDGAGTVVGAASIARDITGQMLVETEVVRLNRELEERVEARTNDLLAKRSELEESQRALMNIVEDLNLKTAELEEANTRLKELDRLKSMFIASMSHELRTPLNSIIGFSSIIRDEWIGPVNQEQKDNLETILRSGKHLLSLINDVIDVSKIEAGRIEARIEEFDLYDLLTEAVQYVDKELREKGLELTLQFQHHVLHTDKRRLLQCVINLLSNAVKFTEKGTITALSSIGDAWPGDDRKRKTTDEGKTVIITIRDTGIGIAEEDISLLFEPFVRLESPLRATAPGTGLGLYLTRKLVVEVLHGDIVCSSEVGVGSTFSLMIPERIDAKGISG